NAPANTVIYTLSLHDALPISASENFFKEETLTALREMALRATTEHVDQELRDVMRTKRIHMPWKSGQRLGVGVGPSPFSGQLIRDRKSTRLNSSHDQISYAVF